MVRLKNRKYVSQVVLASAATIHDDNGRFVRAQPGDTVLTDDQGHVTVKTRAQMQNETEIVQGVTRDKSAQFTVSTLTSPATVTTSDGLVQRGRIGDYLVTNQSSGESRIVRPQDYVQQYE